MIGLLYDIGILILQGGLKIAGWWNPGIRSWNRQRQEVLDGATPSDDVPVVWLHCASHGEFEQIRPVLSVLKKESNPFILLTFFSPSGYNAVNETALVDAKYYLPLDKKDAMVRLIDRWKPHVYIGVQYEYWIRMWQALSEKKVAMIQTNVHATDRNFLSFPLRSLLFPSFRKAHTVFVLDAQSKRAVLDQFPSLSVKISNDTRIENVVQRKKSLLNTEKYPGWTIVWGSIYPHEMKMISRVIRATPTIRHILVPHHVDSGTLRRIKRQIPGRFAVLESGQTSTSSIVLTTSMGKLFGLYSSADAAYVGGGLKGRIHNVYEALVFKIPVMVGHRARMSPGIPSLLDGGFLYEIRSAEDCIDKINHLMNSDLYSLSEDIDQFFTRAHSGSAAIANTVLKILGENKKG